MTWCKIIFTLMLALPAAAIQILLIVWVWHQHGYAVEDQYAMQLVYLYVPAALLFSLFPPTFFAMVAILRQWSCRFLVSLTVAVLAAMCVLAPLVEHWRLP